MAFLNSINIVGSGLTAQQLRLDIISENITNSQTTRVENGDGPYRRKMVVFQAESNRNTFRQAMARASAASNQSGSRLVSNGMVKPTAGGGRPQRLQSGLRPHPSRRQRGRVCGAAQCGHGEGNRRRHGGHPGIQLQRDGI